MDNGTKEKRSAEADTEREAKEIILHKNRAEKDDAPRIQDMLLVDL